MTGDINNRKEVGPIFWRKKSAESPSDRSVEELAGRLLCAYVGMDYRRDTAKYLAGVVKEGRWWELSPDTAKALGSVEAKLLADLVSDILD